MKRKKIETALGSAGIEARELAWQQAHLSLVWRSLFERFLDEHNRLVDALGATQDALRGAVAVKDAAYLERNQVVALLAAVFPSVQCKTTIEGWGECWQNCVYIELPTGQASWHYHDDHVELFAHVPQGEVHWDGHSTEEKYERVRRACDRSGRKKSTGGLEGAC